MARTAKSWFREERQGWFVAVRGERRNLGSDKEEAHRRFHQLLAEKPKPTSVVRTSAAISVVELFG
jgi:hypothetical protein